MTPILTSSDLAPTVADAGPQPPAPPKLVASDRRPDPSRWEHVIPPALAAELGDAAELKRTATSIERWQAATKRVGDLRRRHAEALEHDREAEQEFAAGATRKLPEPTAPPLELELAGAQRAVEVLERELVASGRRLFAASLEHVPAARAALERAARRATTTASPSLLGRRSRARRARARGAEAGWLHAGAMGNRVAPFLPRARRRPDRRRARASW